MATIRHIAERRGTALYEPVFDLDTSWVVGVEALSPQVSDGTDAVHAAVAALSSLPSRTFVSVRLASRSLGRLLSLLEGHNLDRVVLHLDQPAIELRMLGATIADFRDRGGRLALDVGAGPVALRRVAELEPDLIELATSVSRGIDTDRSRRAAAIALVALGEQTGGRVEAQGISTAGELATLRGMGVAYGRGPILAEPFPLTELFPDVPPDAA